MNADEQRFILEDKRMRRSMEKLSTFRAQQ